MSKLKIGEIEIEISKEEQITRDLTKKYGKSLLQLLSKNHKLPIIEFDRIGIDDKESPILAEELCRLKLIKQDENNKKYFEITILGRGVMNDFDTYYSDNINAIDNQRKEELYDKRITREKIENTIQHYKTTRIISIIALIFSFISLVWQILTILIQ